MLHTSKAIAFGLISGVFASIPAFAEITTDAHGNVGYDSAAECDAAVQSGNARFYQPFTHKPTKLRPGETSVRTGRLSDLGPDYRLGACDLGVGKKFGRDGVAKVLQGKYVPYSPDTPINAYSNRAGEVVRVSMIPCDNNFSGPLPRPVPIPAATPEPQAVVAPAPVVTEPEPSGITPYVFGTVGALRDKVSYSAATSSGDISDKDNRFAGQVGAGLQFNDWLGAELFYQGGQRLKFETDNGDEAKARNNTYGARLTVGNEVAQGFRLFGKLGIAGVEHSLSGEWDGDHGSSTKARATAGLGMLVNLTDSLFLRADYDHYFKSGSDNPKWKDADYLGIGLQYNFN